LPPVLAGGVQETVAELSPATAPTFVGAPGFEPLLGVAQRVVRAQSIVSETPRIARWPSEPVREPLAAELAGAEAVMENPALLKLLSWHWVTNGGGDTGHAPVSLTLEADSCPAVALQVAPAL